MELEFLRKELLGGQTYINTPYGKKIMTYADYTASGRNLIFVEEYMMKIGETYANTHTEDCFLGRETTRLYHQAKERIRTLLKANDDYVVLTVGSGTTGAILRLAQILGIYEAPATRVKYNKDSKYYNPKRPIVFVGPYEHHSNELIWKEGNAEVVEIALTSDGKFSLFDLETKISDPKYKDRIKIGAFSAASNVTGMQSPVKEITALVHKYDGLVFFDFAASGPYVDIEIIQEDGDYYDGIYLSPHKFIGGPGSSGILVFKKDLYNDNVGPTCAGGGTVEYVSSTNYDFITDIEKREDAGTPAILQTIRAAIALEIKENVGLAKIEGIEECYIKGAIERLVNNSSIEIIGPKDLKHRLGILSFNVRYRDKYLHPRFVTTLLNDLFGIQSRAGCSCAGPYGHLLLGIEADKSDRYRDVIKSGCEAMKPGWVRVNFHYLLEAYAYEYILEAIEFIGAYGYLFLRDYSVESHTGNWKHSDITGKKPVSGEPFGIEALINSVGYVPLRYDARLTMENYSEAMLHAQKLKSRYLLKENRLELFEEEKMTDIAWFYVWNSDSI